MGSCAVCTRPARTRCSSCRRAFYCDRRHQKADWPRHRAHCQAYEERDDGPGLGRFLLATRDLEPGELVFSEAPLVWGPRPHVEARVCVGCGVAGVGARCPGCCWPACRPDCPALAGPHSAHAEECAVLESAGFRLLPSCRNLLALRIIITKRNHPRRWEALMKLQSHLEHRGEGTEAHQETRMAARYLFPVIQLDPSVEALLPTICGLIDVNALDTNPPEGSAAIYRTACLLEHHCIANTRLLFKSDGHGRPRINVMAVTSIKKGEHLRTTYTHVLWTTAARREHLLETKYFACECERCADPTEFGSHLSSLKCSNDEGFVTPRKPLDPNSDWECNKCGSTLSTEEARYVIDNLGIEVAKVMEQPDKNRMSDLLERLMVILHPSHMHCITVGHSLIQMLPPEEPSKVELCRRILETIDIVDPYNTRLPLYRATTLRELSKCPGQDKTDLLMKAIESLRYEPPDSPGDKLSKIIIAEA